MAEFFIHVADVGFPDEPWPGVRRLGPYQTTDEAVAQAVSDAVGGQTPAGSILGIYDDEGSEALRGEDDQRAKVAQPVVTAKEIAAAAKTEARARAARARFEVEAQAGRDELLAGLLAPGVTPDDLRDLGLWV